MILLPTSGWDSKHAVTTQLFRIARQLRGTSIACGFMHYSKMSLGENICIIKTHPSDVLSLLNFGICPLNFGICPS